MADKHAAHDLKQMQSLPLEAKIIMTQQRIRQWYEYWDGMVYASVSGIVSTVMKHLIDHTPGVYGVPALYVNTGLEYPEVQAFWRDVANEKYDCFDPDVEIVRPKMRFDEVLKTYGYPVISKEVAKVVQSAKSGPEGRWKEQCIKMLNGERMTSQGNKSMFNKEKWKFLLGADFPISHRCCDVMKKNPAKSYEKATRRHPFVGTMAEESKLREQMWRKQGCNAFTNARPISTPMSFWTKQDVLHYAKKYNVPYPSVYGDIVLDDGGAEQMNISDYLEDYAPIDKLKTTGCDRTGCIFCVFGCHREGTPNRFQRLKETHPRQYDYCIGGGEYVWKGTAYTSNNEPRELSWINDDDSPMSSEEIESFVEENKDNPCLKFEKVWQPSKEGLGMGKVLDYIGVKYD